MKAGSCPSIRPQGGKADEDGGWHEFVYDRGGRFERKHPRFDAALFTGVLAMEGDVAFNPL